MTIPRSEWYRAWRTGDASSRERRAQIAMMAVAIAALVIIIGAMLI